MTAIYATIGIILLIISILAPVFGIHFVVAIIMTIIGSLLLGFAVAGYHRASQLPGVHTHHH
jgi:membrane-bound ClpP family serine protease